MAAGPLMGRGSRASRPHSLLLLRRCPQPPSVFPDQIQTKTVAQCVEYYYIWKKMIKFDCGRAPGPEKRVRREPDEVDRAEAKVGGLGAGGLEFSPIRRPGAYPCWAGVGVLPAGGAFHGRCSHGLWVRAGPLAG